MKRGYALGALALLIAVLLMVLWVMPVGGPLVGDWEATVELSGGSETAPVSASACLRYTFHQNGTYTCVVTAGPGGAEGEVQLQGNYTAQGDRLYMSQGLDYKIDPGTYDRYRLEGDALTLLENAQGGDMGGFYPLTLTRVEQS